MIVTEFRRRDEKTESKFASAFQAPTQRPATSSYNQSRQQPRGGQDEYEEIKEDSLTRLKQTHSGSKQYVVPKDPEFESFPEIT